jgi:tetratricopeptide (TPR) repeat protein
MPTHKVFSLESIRTDGWFERVGEKVGSFEALCSILGERFFAFSLITGARVTSLTVDRRNPTASVVEFEVSGAGSAGGPVTQRLTLDRFRKRLVSALLAEEATHAAPTRETDVEGIQLFIGVRYLLLAPLFGYSLLELRCAEAEAVVRVNHDGEERDFGLGEFRAILRRWVLEELDRAGAGADPARSGLDLSVLPEAHAAADNDDPAGVVALLGGWLMPLTFYHRTPEGRALTADTRGRLGEALGLLGTALMAQGDGEAGQQSLRLAVQYAVDTPAAADAYTRMGEAFLSLGRFGESIAPLRRASQLGASPDRVWPALGLAFLEERRLLASWGAVLEAASAGVDDEACASLRTRLNAQLPALARWQELIQSGAETG